MRVSGGCAARTGCGSCARSTPGGRPPNACLRSTRRSPRMFRPSGEQIELRHGAARATVVEVGGGLRSFDVDGVGVIDGYAEDEMASAGRGQVLLPWPNRVDGGKWHWEGKDQQLAISEVKKNNAMHGLVRWAGWRLERTSDASAV